MAWIKEKGESKSYLVMKKFVKQCCFECLSLKQMKIMVYVDGCSKKLGSVMLASVQIENYHCWSMEKTEHEMELPAGI